MAETSKLKLTLTSDTDASTTTFKQWRQAINGDDSTSNMNKIDKFASDTDTILANKVDKIDGKQLSTNDFTNADKIAISTNTTDITTLKTTVANKVDKVTGKGLSTNDYTNAAKAKVDAIPTNPKYTDTTYTAGTGINITNNIISATGGTSTGDVTAAGNNTFTGQNTFEDETSFSGSVHISDLDVNGRTDLAETNFYGDVTFSPQASVKIQTQLDMTSYKIVNLSTPESNLDAVNKEYVDNNIAGITSGMKNLKDGTSTDKTAVNATSINSVYMNNTESITEPADGGDKHTALTSTTAPTASGTGSLAIGSGTSALGDVSLAEGINTIAGRVRNTSTGERNTAAHAEGVGSKAIASASHAEGYYSQALGSNSHVEGFFNTVSESAISGHAEGRENNVTGSAGHAENFGNTVSGADAHAEGHGNTASGDYSHVEGVSSTAEGKASHAEGNSTVAHGTYSHVEGDRTYASTGSHAEGVLSKAYYRSHAEGEETVAGKEDGTTRGAHAEGIRSQATGSASHASGIGTIASATAQFVVGTYNLESDDALFIVGNGTKSGETENRKNVFEISRQGTGKLNNQNILTAANIKTDVAKTFTGYSSSNPNQVLGHDTTGNFKWTTNSASITGATANATTLSYYEQATASVTLKNGVLNFDFGIPQGEPGDNTCLIEGTKITMADNTTKAIEELKEGDEVLSYNPLTKQKVTAVVLACYQTGVANRFDVYSFEDGNYITAYKVHGFFANDIGYIRNIQNITRKNELINQNLEYTYLIKSDKMNVYGAPKARYNLIVSNNLYFANGILLGHTPQMKGTYYVKYNKMDTLPEAIKTAYQEEVDKYNEFNAFMNTAEFHSEVAESQAKLYDAINEIKAAKANLTATDYKVQKYTEGVLSEEEWEEAKTRRAAWRQTVNDNEALQAQIKVTVNEIVSKYRHGVTPKQLFEDACEKDNELFETIKNYFEVK